MKRLLLFVILFTTTTTGYTEPGLAVQYLMGEPATLFDLGMARLEQRLSGFNPKDTRTTWVDVYYKWDENRISIRGVIGTHKAESVQLRKKRCEEIITHFRRELAGIFMVRAPGVTSDLYELFSHNGFSRSFSRKDKPKNLAAELGVITELSGFVYYTTDSPSTRCKRALLGGEILYSSKILGRHDTTPPFGDGRRLMPIGGADCQISAAK